MGSKTSRSAQGRSKLMAHVEQQLLLGVEHAADADGHGIEGFGQSVKFKQPAPGHLMVQMALADLLYPYRQEFQRLQVTSNHKVGCKDDGYQQGDLHEHPPFPARGHDVFFLEDKDKITGTVLDDRGVGVPVIPITDQGELLRDLQLELPERWDFIRCRPGHSGTFITDLQRGFFCDLPRPFQAGRCSQVVDHIVQMPDKILLQEGSWRFFKLIPKKADNEDDDRETGGQADQKESRKDGMSDSVDRPTAHLPFPRQ